MNLNHNKGSIMDIKLDDKRNEELQQASEEITDLIHPKHLTVVFLIALCLTGYFYEGPWL